MLDIGQVVGLLEKVVAKLAAKLHVILSCIITNNYAFQLGSNRKT